MISFRSISYETFYRSWGAYPRFGERPDLPIPEAKVRSEMMRKARSERQMGHQTLIGGSYLPLGHFSQVGLCA